MFLSRWITIVDDSPNEYPNLIPFLSQFMAKKPWSFRQMHIQAFIKKKKKKK